MKGYLEQKGTPTPDKPVEIKSKLIGKNLFETYEVNSRTYTGNLPKNAFISIPKKQYIEYEQQKEEIERLNNIINDFEKYLIEEIEDYEKQIKYHKKNKDLRSGILDLVGEYEGEKVCFEDMLGKLQELKGSDKE